ncbi:hypothetical protein EC991_009148 [Linnemannia zychae]|nr:hypothetical protein EC991_009148 [Linnemannia zychae]
MSRLGLYLLASCLLLERIRWNLYTGPSKEQNAAEWLGCTAVSSDFNDYVNSIKLGDNSRVHVFFKDYNCKSSYLIVPKGNVDLSDLSYYGFNNQISSFCVSKTAPPCQWKCGDLCCGDA